MNRIKKNDGGGGTFPVEKATELGDVRVITSPATLPVGLCRLHLYGS